MAEEEGTEEGQGKKKKGNMLIVIIIVFLFVLLLVIVGAIAFLMFSSNDEAKKEEKVKQEEKKLAHEKKQVLKDMKRGTDYSHIGPMFPLEPFTLNLLSDSGNRYVKCTIELEQDGPELGPELTKKVPIIRDIIIRTISAKTFEEIATTKGKEMLKDELVGKINEILTDGAIKNIYFTSFVVS